MYVISKWYAFIGFGLLFSFIIVAIQSKQVIIINTVDLLLILLAVYVLIRVIADDNIYKQTNTLSAVTFVLIYYSFKILSNPPLKHFNLLVVVVCTLQSIYGLIQGCAENGAYNVVGSFDNPAGFAACLVVGAPFCFSLINIGGWQRKFGIGSILIVSSAVIFSGSRTGIVAMAAVLLYWLINRHSPLRTLIRKYIGLLLLVVVLCLAGLFLWKKDSALGRISIWQTSCEMIADKLLFGHGQGKFLSEFMPYQAKVLGSNPENPLAILADNVTHPLNEDLLFTIEYGVVGLLLIMTILWLVVKYNRRKEVFLVFISIYVFACFSYPYRYPFVLVVIAYALSMLESRKLYTCQISTVARIALCVGICAAFVGLSNDIRYEKRWTQLTRQSMFRPKETLIDQYAYLHSRWNGNPLFLYNYATVLNQVKEYNKSNAMMLFCTEYLNDYDVQMIIAANYSALGKYKEADMHYLAAQSMIPCRFLPLYRRMLLCKQIGDLPLMQTLAKNIIAKDVKVPSRVIFDIKREAQEVVLQD